MSYFSFAPSARRLLLSTRISSPLNDCEFRFARIYTDFCLAKVHVRRYQIILCISLTQARCVFNPEPVIQATSQADRNTYRFNGKKMLAMTNKECIVINEENKNKFDMISMFLVESRPLSSVGSIYSFPVCSNKLLNINKQRLKH